MAFAKRTPSTGRRKKTDTGPLPSVRRSRPGSRSGGGITARSMGLSTARSGSRSVWSSSGSSTVRSGVSFSSYKPPHASRLLPFVEEEKKMSIEEMRELVLRSIEQGTRKDTEVFQHVFRMFGRPEGGFITPKMFKQQMAKNFGLHLTDEENEALFASYDKEGSGKMTLQLFLKRVLPTDYTRKTWAEIRDEEITREEEAREQYFAPHLEELPQSIKGRRWPLSKLEAKLQRKIEERTKRPSDQYRLAYALFGSPGAGITPEEFKKHVQALGIVITDDELAQLMKKYDDDGNGVIDFAELIQNIMPKDYTGKQWYETRDEEIDEYLAASGAKDAPTLKTWPKSLEGQKLTVDQLRDQLQLKIVERTKRANDQFREAFAMFGSPQHGIRLEDFAERLATFGIVASPRSMKKLFRKLDTSKSGVITFTELVQNVMPPDYKARQWYEDRDDAIEKEEEMRASRHDPQLRDWPKSLEKNRWTLEEIEATIQQKIVERTKRPSDQYREAYAMFGSPAGGITRDAMKAKLGEMGLVLSDADVDAMFKKYDLDGSGSITFSELVIGVMPQDYTADPWNVARDEEADREAKFLAAHRLRLTKGPAHMRGAQTKHRHSHHRRRHHRSHKSRKPDGGLGIVPEDGAAGGAGGSAHPPRPETGGSGGHGLGASKSEPALATSRALPSSRAAAKLPTSSVGLGQVGVKSARSVGSRKPTASRRSVPKLKL